VRELRDVDYRAGRLEFVSRTGDRVFDGLEMNDRDLAERVVLIGVLFLAQFALDAAQGAVRELECHGGRARPQRTGGSASPGAIGSDGPGAATAAAASAAALAASVACSRSYSRGCS
jgi:hypothetical protein